MEDFNKNMKRRVNMMYICFLLVAFAIVGRTAFLIFVQGPKITEEVEEKTTRMIDVQAKRGNIYSADSSILVMTMPIFTVRMDLHESVVPKDTFNLYKRALADSLAKMYPKKSAKEYLKSLNEARSKDLGVNPRTKEPRGRGSRNFLIARNIRYAELKRLQTFPILKKGKNRGGLIIEESDRRIRVHQLLAERAIGYYNKESGRAVGLEGAYNDILKGRNGKRVERKVANGVWRPVFGDQQEPENGKDIVTTIDMRVQDVAESALMRCLRRNNASHGCAVLMEVSTGEIRAIANLKRGTDSIYREEENFAVNESVEPGSTFKLASLIAILEAGKMDTGTIVPTGKMKFANREMKDSKEEGYGDISLKHAFELSSNVGIAYAARESFSQNEKTFTDYLYKMRLNQPLGIEIAGERPPFIKNPTTVVNKKKVWWGTSLPWISHGYEVLITPLQQLTFYNAVANNGTMVKPMFVKEIRSGGQVVEHFEPIVLASNICSKKTIEKVKDCLEGVVLNGTAKSLSKSPYKIAGKTGTAVANYAQRGVEKRRYRASFIGYFPADDPKYTCLVIVTDPSGFYKYGGEVAAPVFKEIADKVYATHLNMDSQLPDVENVQTPEKNTLKESVEDRILSSKTIPNVKGLSAKDAVYVLEKLGYKVMVRGRGTVREQSINAGEPVVPGQQIWLRLL